MIPPFNCYIPRPKLRGAGDFPGNTVDQEHLPEELKGKKYYSPSDSGHEKTIKERIKERRRLGVRQTSLTF